MGLVYLKTASEELATPREDLPIQRKNELLRFLSTQVPLTLDSLTSTILSLCHNFGFVHLRQAYNYFLSDSVLLKEATKLQSRSGTVTPPPSPTSGQSVAPARGILDVEGLATGSTEVCIATLDVLAHLFSWIELSEHISSNLLDVVFTCARYHDAMVRGVCVQRYNIL